VAQVIQSNQDVIAYLNEEVNKWQIGLRVTTGAVAPAAAAARDVYVGEYRAPSGRLYAPLSENDLDADGLLLSTTNAYGHTPVPPAPHRSHSHSHSHSHGDAAAGLYAPKPTADVDLDAALSLAPTPSTSHHHPSRGAASAAAQGSVATYLDDTRDGSVTRQDVYLRGMRNLGLGDSFGDLEDLGLDLTVGEATGTGGKENNEPTGDVDSVTAGGKKGSGYHGRAAAAGVGAWPDKGLGSYATSAGRPRARLTSGIDLESLDYYKTGHAVSTPQSARTRPSASAAKIISPVAGQPLTYSRLTNQYALE
jgi:hypothetical protein